MADRASGSLTARGVLSGTVEPAEEIRREDAFVDDMRCMTPHVWAMPAVAALCALVWLLMVLQSGQFHPDSSQLLRWGANRTGSVLAGEWWRLLTAMFVHGSIVHLLINMCALFEIGFLLTRMYGNAGFLLVFIGSGLVGNALSLHYAAHVGVSLGASGAAFGVVGALFVATLRHRDKVPHAFWRWLVTSLLILIVGSLAYGFYKQGIDNAAHIGGLAAGCGLGWLLIAKFDQDAAVDVRLQRMLGGAVLCIAAALLLIDSVP